MDVFDHTGSAEAALEANLPAERLVPGDIDAVHAAAEQAETMADTLLDAARGLSYIDADWTGRSADRFRDVMDYQPKEFKKAAEAFTDACQALTTYASTLTGARHAAEKARQMYQQGKADQRRAQAGDPTAPPPGPDNYGLPGAVAMLVEARHDVELAGRDAASTLRAGAAAAPRPSKPGPYLNPTWKNVIHWETSGAQVPDTWKRDQGLRGLGAGLLQSAADLTSMVSPLSGSAAPIDRLIDYKESSTSWRYDAGYVALVVGSAGVGGGAGAAKSAKGAKGASRLISRIFKKPISEDGVETLVSRGSAPQFWRVSEFKGSRVYQRDDLFDPHYVGPDGRTNLERMADGLTPYGTDGKKLNLHHMTQRNQSAIAELTHTMHKDWSKIIHINPNTIPSGINRSAFDRWRVAYWENRATDFGD